MLNKRKAKEENDSHRKKCRKNDASYIIFGFTSQGPYSMQTIRKVVAPIRYDKSVSASAIR